MVWFIRSSRLIFNAFCRYSSKNTLIRTPVQESWSRFNFFPHCWKPSFDKSRISEFSRPILSNSALQNGFKSVHCNGPLLNGAKRFYSVGRKQDSHFRQRKYKWWIGTLAFSCYSLMTVNPELAMHNEYLETVPFSRRIHYVRESIESAREIGESIFDQIERPIHQEKRLPLDHPDTIRIQGIARNIIEAIQNEDKWPKEDEVLDDHGAQKSREDGQAKGTKSGSRHLEGLEWEVIVVDKPTVNASCLPGGKITFFTGLLKHLRSDDEIAFIIGHEVAHIVARHGAEIISKFQWWTSLQQTLAPFVPQCVFNILSPLLQLPLSERLEVEADYIGMLLMSFAGYDPGVTPGVMEKLGIFGPLRVISATIHAEDIQEAMDLYRETAGKSSVQPSTSSTILKDTSN